MDIKRYRKRVVIGLSVVVLGAMAAVYPGGPRSQPAPMDGLVEHVDEAPSYESEAAGAAEARLNGLRANAAPSEYIDALGSEVKWDLPPVRTERVDFWIDFLAGKNYDNTRKWLERQGRYAPFIREALRENDMPQDLLYLAMIESGLSPYAYSRAAASGMWQFIAETGRRYGLRVDGYVDERRDPIASTHAALDYLGDMHDDFGSWFLAGAGYNSGENRVERLLRQYAGGATGDEGLYWIIGPHLPRETRDYVPLMLAAAHIAKQPDEYGFHDLEYQAPLEYVEVDVPGGVSLGTVASAAGVARDIVEDLNPHLTRGITPPGETWAVRIPVGTSPEFAANFERLHEEVLASNVEHTLRRGETLSHLSRRFGVTVEAIRQANGGINPRRLHAGQRLIIPVAHGTVASEAADEASWSTHRVARGETLWGIARHYDVGLSELRSWNALGRSSRILPGQRLKVRIS